MTANLTTASIKASGAISPRTMAEHLGDIINVRGCGAKGDGVTDDTAAVQLAFDTAFGPAASPHATDNSFLNRPVYFPAGQYAISSPLYLTRVSGGHIFGDGANSTRLFYTGPFNGNVLAPSTGGANAITPLIMTNGFNYSRIERLNLGMGNSNSTCLYLWGAFSCNANTFSDLLVSGASTGILVGYQTSSVAVSECLFNNVTIGNCAGFGLRVIGQNTLNHQVYGGGCFSCGTGYSVATGSIALIEGMANADNGLDVENLGSLPMAIVGGRSESGNVFDCRSSYMHISSFAQDNNIGGVFCQLGGTGTAIMDACRVVSTTATINGSAGSRLYVRGCTFANPNMVSAAFTGTLGQNI